MYFIKKWWDLTCVTGPFKINKYQQT